MTEETELSRGPATGLSEDLAATLRRRILGEELLPGSKLPSESELAGEFAVSRTVVREAISRLRAAGVVETFQGRGTFVLAVHDEAPAGTGFAVASRADLARLMELRIAVETESAALAAQRLSTPRRAALDRALASFEAVRGHPERVVGADFAFHLAVAQASENPYLIEVLQSLGPRAIMLHRSQLGTDDAADDAAHLELLAHEHRAIHEAVSRGDTDAARAAMRVHLARSLAALGSG